MPTFFLHLHECGDINLDEFGVNVADIMAARVVAVEAARDVMCAEVKEGRLCLSCHIEIMDAAGAMLTIVPFRDAIRVTGL